MNWTRDAVRAELVGVLRHHVGEGTEITEQSRLVADLGIDSLAVMELVADLEDKFGITIPDEGLREIESVGDVVAAITSKIKQNGRLEG